MILDKEVIIKISIKNVTHYKNLNYNAKINSDLIVKTCDLTRGSHVYITVKCDYCGEIKKISYKNYYKLTLNLIEKYSCFNCREIRRKKTNLMKYGNEKYVNVDKMKETNLIRYNCEWGLQNRKVKEKSKQTCLIKFGCENPMQNEEVKEKSKRTCLIKFGCENPAQNVNIIQKITNSKIKNGIQNKYNKNEFQIYRQLVDKYTYHNKKELFENWNGLDYYDGEYIKNYYNYHHNHKFYPNVDHKISVYYGFCNNIHPKEIADINNLCITKKYLNRKKSIKCSV
jgi:hypothetical protein